jgi:hypothetical protein
MSLVFPFSLNFEDMPKNTILALCKQENGVINKKIIFSFTLVMLDLNQKSIKYRYYGLPKVDTVRTTKTSALSNLLYLLHS